MKARSLLLLALPLFFTLACLVGGPTRDGSRSTSLRGGGPRDSGSGEPGVDTLSSSSGSPGRSFTREELEAAKSLVGAEYEEPEDGVLRVAVVDSAGQRLRSARVLLFDAAMRAEPFRQLDVVPPRFEASLELPAGTVIWALADPRSLGDGLVQIPMNPKARSGAPLEAAGTAEAPERAYVPMFAEVRPGEVCELEIPVARLGSLRGQLVADDGEWIRGATVVLKGTEGAVLGVQRSTQTDDEGAFVFDEVFPGSFRLSFPARFNESPGRTIFPIELEVPEGDLLDLAWIHAGGGGGRVSGRVVDQDGEPFAGLAILAYPHKPSSEGSNSHDWSSSVGLTRTGLDGRFELSGLPLARLRLSLSSEYNLREAGGQGTPAFWVPDVEVDLSQEAQVDVGTQVVEESRPCRVLGEVRFDPGWLLDPRRGAHQLRAHVSLAPGVSMPKGVRRRSLSRLPLEFDPEAGRLTGVVETPRPKVELRIELEGYEDLVRVFHPEPNGTFQIEVWVPADFTEL